MKRPSPASLHYFSPLWCFYLPATSDVVYGSNFLSLYGFSSVSETESRRAALLQSRLCFAVVVDLKVPVQACREAQVEPGKGAWLSER